MDADTKQHGSFGMTVIVGIPACARMRDEQLRHETPARYAAAVEGGASAVPILIPPVGEAQCAVLDRLDGLLVPGSPSNVHPRCYGGGESLTPDLHDPERDATTLPLIRKALACGVPLLAICRGVQELNVALGGSLHQCVHNLPGRDDHRGGSAPIEDQYRAKHFVTLSGSLAEIIGAAQIRVNSVPGQAIDRLAPGLVAEAVAGDGTIEGVRVASAVSFALGVQWHPEWRYADDPASLALFRAFGAACQVYFDAQRRSQRSLGAQGASLQTI